MKDYFDGWAWGERLAPDSRRSPHGPPIAGGDPPRSPRCPFDD
jgi:hypothetical protein